MIKFRGTIIQLISTKKGWFHFFLNLRTTHIIILSRSYGTFHHCAIFSMRSGTHLFIGVSQSQFKSEISIVFRGEKSQVSGLIHV